MKQKKRVCMGMAAMSLFAAASVQASLFTEDFEGVDPLNNFTFVDNSAGANSQAIVTATGDNTTEVARIVGTSRTTASHPGAWIQPSLLAIDTTEDFSVSFDMYLDSTSGFADAMFLVGDLSGGVTGSRYYGYIMNYNVTFSEAILYNDASAGDKDALGKLSGSNITRSTWVTANYAWDADADTMSCLITSLDGNTTLQTDSRVLALGSTVNVGFGTQNDTVQLDNINVIPEPATLGLVGFFGVGLLVVRRILQI